MWFDLAMTERHASTFTLTLPSEEAARTAADELARRGHRLVAVRIVDHFHFDPDSWWYGKPSMRPEFTGWWNVFSLLSGPFPPPENEKAVVRTIARDHGGISDGAGGGLESTVLTVFNRTGLVHELSETEVLHRRSELADPAVPGRPELRPAPPLARRATEDEQAELAAIAEQVAFEEDGDEDDEPADAGELLGILFNDALDEGVCYPHTAAKVPGFVALILDERMGDLHRAWLYLDLFMIATVGRRYLCSLADRQHALGQPLVETPDAIAARRAVAEVLPRLAERWDEESEAGRFFLAGLVAACPEAGGMLRPSIGQLREAHPGTVREATVRLIEALADTDPEPIEAALRDISVRRMPDSPYATAEQRGLSVLEHLLIEELDRV